MENIILQKIDEVFGYCVSVLEKFLFLRIFHFPFVVIVLVLGAIVFTFYMRFINIRGFRHAIEIIRGKYDNTNDTGQISHFQALTFALSATIGLGNIAGVAVAVARGGPGAVFWMMTIAVFGMSTKFVSCTLSQMYRQMNSDGSISGGPMYYLSIGLRERGFPRIGKIFGCLFAFFIVVGSFGIGNMFQANQSYELVATQIPLFAQHSWLYGVLLAGLVALVIIGGIVRIGRATQRIVPGMCLIYVVAALFIIVTNIERLPSVLLTIVSQAFNPDAFYGGAIGIIVIGVQRAAFSNEAGIGSAAIAHAAAKTNEPVREGLVAMIGPFIDTIVICFLTACVLLITADQNDQYQSYVDAKVEVYQASAFYAQASSATQKDSAVKRLEIARSVLEDKERGVEFTSEAFASVISWFPIILSVVVFLFSYSTMIAWYYYGEKGWGYLFSPRTVIIYKVFYLACIVLGAIAKLGNVLDLSDMLILCCVFPNIIGAFFLLPIVKKEVLDYWSRYKKGEFNNNRVLN